MTAAAATPPPPHPLKRLIRFGGLQIANAIAPLAVLPAVISLIGPEGWVGLANGIGIGAAAAVAVGTAWPITGPARVAGVDPEQARRVFRESLAQRLMLLLPVMAISVTAIVLLVPPGGDPVLPATMALATALNGLAANWYYIGRAQPGGIVAYETFPKLAATALAIPAVMLSAQPLAYPLLLGIAALGGVALSARSITAGEPVLGEWGAAWRGLRHQLPLGLAGVLSTGTSALTVPVATGAGAGVPDVARFAAAIRLRTMTQAGIGAGTSALQGWVSESGVEVWRRRATRALGVNAGLGFAAGLVIAVAAPILDTWIFPGVEIGWGLSALLGLACLCYGLSASLSHHILAPAGRTRLIVSTTLVASILAIPLVYFGSRLWGAVGAMGAVVVAEGLVVVLQGVAARRALRDTTRLTSDREPSAE